MSTIVRKLPFIDICIDFKMRFNVHIYLYRTCLFVFTASMIYVWSSCQKDNIVTEAFVDLELQTLYDQFADEGKKRNIEVDFASTPIEGFISNDLGTSITGQCQHDADQPDRVLVNQSYWNNATALQREFVVFHELGHCYLNRTHLDDKDSKGVCKSMMHSGSSICRNEYSAETRAAYLDELFQPN